MTYSLKNTPVFTVHLPEYTVDAEPEHGVVGKIVDDEIKKHFLGQSILLRGLASVEHPGKSIDELIEIIKRDGTDRYDPNRIGDRYENVENKHIDLFALKFDVTKDSEMFSQLTWPFYHWGIKDRGFPLRCDVLIIYDPAQLRQVEFTYAGREHEGARDDGFVFRNQNNKPTAIKAIFKITG